MSRVFLSLFALLTVLPGFAADWEGFIGPVTVEQRRSIAAHLPKAAPVKVESPRRILVMTLTKGFRHKSIPHGTYAMKVLGDGTGAYSIEHTEDPAAFTAENLQRFDAVMMLNTTGTLFTEPERRQALVDFVKEGGGLIGIHSATDTFHDWPEYGKMMGGYFWGHPWHANDQVRLKMEDPDHSTCTCFEGQPFDIQDEIYQYKPEPYSRDELRILYSLDPSGTDMTSDKMKKRMRREDGDYPVGWVRAYGEGKVFYSNLGHNEKTYWNPTVLQHFLAGIQFATGDLEGETTPSGALKK